MLLHHHRVQYHHNFTSHRLQQPRDIIVWLPFNYGQRKKKYPVLYMHDGQNLIDPSTAFLGRPWGIDATIDRLVELGGSREALPDQDAAYQAEQARQAAWDAMAEQPRKTKTK